jgi:hypothetical protein
MAIKITRRLQETVPMNRSVLAMVLGFLGFIGNVQGILLPGSITAADPTFNRTLSFSQGGTCNLSTVGTAVHYRTHSLTMIAAGNLTVSTVASDGASIAPAGADTVIILYGPGGFSPASPCANAIAASDDVSGTAQSRIVTTTPLAAGTYTVVVTSFDNSPPPPNNLPWTYSLYVLGYVSSPPTLQGAASRKPHGGAGTFDLPL